MAALVCDLCGGKLVMGAGGIAVCDSCGMEYSQDRMKEKIQEIKGIVRVDNTHMVDTWMKMGLTAAQSGNNKEAYEYFTKVIEVDPNNWRAIYEKGKAGAWQSTLANLRTSEIYQGIVLALEIIGRSEIDEESLIEIKNEFAVALYNINNAITDLMDQNLRNKDDLYFDIHWDQMWNTRQRYLTNVSQLEDALSLISEFDDDLSKSNVIMFKKRMCRDLNQACSAILYYNDYSQTSVGYLGFETKDKKKYIDKWWKLVCEIREIEPNFCKNKWDYPDPYGPKFHMSEEYYSYWQMIEKSRYNQIEKERKKKQFDEYWAEHAEDKQKFLSRISEIDLEVRKLKRQFEAFEPRISKIKEDLSQIVPAENQMSELIKQQSALNGEKSKLGIFAVKQKRQLQEQINSLQMQINGYAETVKNQKKAISDDVSARILVVENERKPIKNQMDMLEKEKSNIQNELSKER